MQLLKSRVGVAGNDMGLLNGQSTKRDSIASVEWLGLFTKQGFRICDPIAKCTWVMSRKLLESC
jgi:hypothetical protein